MLMVDRKSTSVIELGLSIIINLKYNMNIKNMIKIERKQVN